MSRWPLYPVVYEINTWVWLDRLSQKTGHTVTLDNIAGDELQRLADYGFDAVWLMGVWQRSPEACAADLTRPEIVKACREVLPETYRSHMIGSPFAVKAYQVDPRLGGNEALIQVRQTLWREHGLRLILDFVSNHVALDHAWVDAYPARLLQGDAETWHAQPDGYFESAHGEILAHGKDRYYVWPDTVQLDYRRPETRRGMLETLLEISELCDGLRCDMAMLVLRDVFYEIWGKEPELSWEKEFWPEAIDHIRARHPDFLMLAEAYWDDLDYRLQQQGFDYTYDKRLYDRLVSGDVPSICGHLYAVPKYQRHLARFVENHDEDRAVEKFGRQRSKASAALALTLPGLRLLHQGQLIGSRQKLPVQLGHGPTSTVDADIASFYRKLLASLRHAVFHDGVWELLEPRKTNPDNANWHNLVAYHWKLEAEHWLVAVNLSPDYASGFFSLELPDFAGPTLCLRDFFVNEDEPNSEYIQETEKVHQEGIYIALPGYGYHLFKLQYGFSAESLSAYVSHKGTFSGRDRRFYEIAWSPDGHLLAAGSGDNSVWIWDTDDGQCLHQLKGYEGDVEAIAWAPDTPILATGAKDRKIRLWNIQNGQLLKTLHGLPHNILSLAWSPDGQWLAAGLFGDGWVYLYDVAHDDRPHILQGHSDAVNCVAWSRDGKTLASASGDRTIRLWDIDTFTTRAVLQGDSWISKVVWFGDGKTLAAGTGLGTIDIWNTETHQRDFILEGHTDRILCIALSQDGQWLASKSADRTIKLWKSENFMQIEEGTIKEYGEYLAGLAFHPDKPMLATRDDAENVIHIWDLDTDMLSSDQVTRKSVYYTTAKLVLVGDSGIGKTSLGWRLKSGEFKEQASTHGQQFWVIDDLRVTRDDNTECEAVLWDLAGQHIYRAIHTIFLDNVDFSLILFDPTNRQETLKGVEFWLRQLKGKCALPPSVLVGARVDRGTPVLASQELAQFCQRHDIKGGYIGTSARTGEGIPDLLALLQAHIPWDTITTTITTITFKRIKDYVLALKEQPDRKGVLVSPDELCQKLKASDPDWTFTNAEMLAAVKNLETHGYVTVLETSAGDESILLVPELLVDLAASIVLQADRHPRELGSLEESALLHGDYPLPELANLDEHERYILLDAAVTRFVTHNLCFRETLGTETLLIFPGLIKQKRPLRDDVETIEDVSYIVQGRVENVYAALVVLLGYTRTFTRIHQWQRQAQYELGSSEICGFRLAEEHEGEIELVLYYSTTMPAYGRPLFQGMFEQFLYQHDVDVTVFPLVVCPHNHVQERATVIKRLREGKTFLFCEECGTKIALPAIEKHLASVPSAGWLTQEAALVRLRSVYETYLVRVKSFRRDRAVPRCIISHLPEDGEYVRTLARDLRDASVYVLEDWASVTADDFVLLMDTAHYQARFQSNDAILKDDITCIQARLEFEDSKYAALIELSSIGSFTSSSTRYVLHLLDLVLALYAIPLNHPRFAPLRQDLHMQWERTCKDTGVEISRGALPIGEIRKTLLACGPFTSDAALCAVFVDGRIHPWHDVVPSAGSREKRVDALIDVLHNQYDAAGDNALALFVRVLSERADPQDACHARLAELADLLDHISAAT